jgi:hypothetical protein
MSSRRNYLIMPEKETTKTRDQNFSLSYPRVFDKKTGETRQPAGSRTWEGRQITASEGHKRGPNGYREGGPFYSVRIVPRINTTNVSLSYDQSSKVNWSYSGPICVPLVPEKLGGFSIPSRDDKYLDPYGATAIRIIDPTNANADLGIALGEIARDGISIPGVQGWRRRTEAAKAAGSEYLSAVFGWMPLVSDIKDTGDSIKSGNHILRGYRDNAGRNVRREFEFDDETSEEETVVSTNARAMVAGGSVNAFGNPSIAGTLTRRRFKTVRRWFSGAFTYASPDTPMIGKMLGVDSDIDKLFGLSLTPDIVWELTPWSWAFDWVSNAGDVIHNVTSFELGGLVMRYGFIMEETSIVDTYSLSNAALRGYNGSVPDSTITYTVKRRREANPFGFGLSWDGLSPSQLLITAALGITRLR